MADYANIGTSTDNLFATLRFQLMSGSTLLTTGLTIFITIIIPCAAYIITPPPTRVLFEGIFKFLVESINVGVRSKGKWTFDDIPDMTGKVVIVTGGNTGIGFEIAKGLLKRGAKVYIGARNSLKAESAIKELISLTGCKGENVQSLVLDLADLPTVHTAALEFLSKETKLDILYNNAGIQAPPLEWLSVQGYDMTFAVNVLGPYYFTKLLIPILTRTSSLSTCSSAEHSSSSAVRIIELGSDGHLLNINTHGDPIDYDSLRPSKKRDGLKGTQIYYQSKSANLLLSNYRARTMGNAGRKEDLGDTESARKKEGKGQTESKGQRDEKVSPNGIASLVSICVHPGHIRTNLTQYLPFPEKPVAIWLGHPPAEGAITPLYAGTAPETANMNGKYLITHTRKRLPRSDHINNVEAEDRLVAWLEEQLRIHGLV